MSKTPCNETATTTPESTDWSAIFRSAIESAYDAVLITDAQLEPPGPRVLYVNPAFTEMTGWVAQEIIGRTPRVLQGEDTDPQALRRLREALKEGRSFDTRAVNYRRDGTAFTLEWRTAPMRDASGRITHYIAIQRDVTAEKRLMSRLQHLADFDDLTAVHTRRPAESALKAEFERVERHGVPLAVIMLDIDNFKPVNDEHGHACGDNVLQQMTRLISRRLRENDLLARWGGEEFLVVLPHTAFEGAQEVAEAVRALVEQAVFVDRVGITLSLGVAAHKPGDTLESLLERADEAVYAAKAAGRNRVVTR